MTTGERLAVQLVENALREDLKPIEQARAYRALIDLNGWSVTDAAHMVVNYGPVIERAPGPPGTDTYAHGYQTPATMAPGPATLRVTLRGECDDNYLDNWAPRTIDMPAVPFEVVPVPLHDKASAP